MTPPHQATRRAGRLAVLLGLLLLTLFRTGAGTASAHAELTGTAPSSGSSLSQAPTEVNLQFSEPVQDTSGGDDATWHWVWFALLGGALLMLVAIPLLIRRPR